MEKTPSFQASGSGRKQLSVVLGGIPVQVCGTQSRGEEALACGSTLIGQVQMGLLKFNEVVL